MLHGQSYHLWKPPFTTCIIPLRARKSTEKTNVFSSISPWQNPQRSSKSIVNCYFSLFNPIQPQQIPLKFPMNFPSNPGPPVHRMRAPTRRTAPAGTSDRPSGARSPSEAGRRDFIGTGISWGFHGAWWDVIGIWGFDSWCLMGFNGIQWFFLIGIWCGLMGFYRVFCRDKASNMGCPVGGFWPTKMERKLVDSSAMSNGISWKNYYVFKPPVGDDKFVKTG